MWTQKNEIKNVLDRETEIRSNIQHKDLMTPFVNCDATSEGEPAPTSDMVEKVAMTDDLRSLNTRHSPPTPFPTSKSRKTLWYR